MKGSEKEVAQFGLHFRPFALVEGWRMEGVGYVMIPGCGQSNPSIGWGQGSLALTASNRLGHKSLP